MILACVREAWCSFCVDVVSLCVFFQAEDGIRDLVRSRGLGDVYKRQDPAGGDRAGRVRPVRAVLYEATREAGLPVGVPLRAGLSLIHI